MHNPPSDTIMKYTPWNFEIYDALAPSTAFSAAFILSSVHCLRFELQETRKVAGAECERFRDDNDFVVRGIACLNGKVEK